MTLLFTTPTKQKLLRAELAAGRTISRKLQQVLWRWKFDDDDHGGFNWFIAYLLLIRAERTYSSIRTLARLGLVDDALALVRVMVEKIINAQYIYLADMNTALDYIQFQAFREWRDFEEFNSIEPLLAKKYSEDILKKLKAAHDQAKIRVLPDGTKRERFGRGHDWIDLGLAKRAEKIDQIIGQRLSNPTFKSTRILYHETYKEGASYLHGMFASLARSMKAEANDDAPDKDGRVFISLSARIKDKDMVVATNAVSAANLAAIAILFFIGRVMGKHELLKWAAAFKTEYLSQLKSVREG